MGITFDEKSGMFTFDFQHDNQEDIIYLEASGYQVTAFGKCFHYGYEFTDSVNHNVRSAFIQYLKFQKSLADNQNLTQFIQKAIDDLNAKINLYDYDLVVTPQSSSSVNRYMVQYIYRFAQPMLRHLQLVKSLPERISFDMDSYEQVFLNDTLENGRARYTEAQKQQVRQSIEVMMDLIHKKNYFTIAKDVKKSKMRPYITKFLRFNNESDRLLCEKISNQNVLVLDDVTTSGSTLNEMLRALRILNESNTITIFSLLGRKDLMADCTD